MEQIIVQSAEPIRLDRYLRRHYEGANQGMIEKLLRVGKIKLNNAKAKTSARVTTGDIITIVTGTLQAAEVTEKKFSKDVISLANELLDNHILFSSDDFIAIDKPYGLAIQGGSKIDLSISDAIEYINYRDKANYKIVHRLDKDTTGILLIAKNYDSAEKLNSAFRDHLILKEYIAVLGGCPSSPEGKLVHQIGKDRSDAFEIVKELPFDGKIAETDYKVLNSDGGLSLVLFRPKTGRMHQLRFHSKFLGCPILGDVKYGGKPHSRMLLHAKQIIIPATVFGRKIIINSDMPDEFIIDIKNEGRPSSRPTRR